MKTIRIKAIQLNDRGDILLKNVNNEYFVKIADYDRVAVYSFEEMAEIYEVEKLHTLLKTL